MTSADPATNTQTASPVPPPGRVGIAASASLALWVCVATVYALRPDVLAAITLVPLWLWAFPGLLLAGLAVSRRRRLAGWTLVAVWTSWTLLCADETPGLLRSLMPMHRRAWQAAFEQGRTIRIVSINCGDGGSATLRELHDISPDIVLSQESPGKQLVTELARELFGDDAGAAVAGPDAAILVRGTILEHGVPAGAPGNAVWARVQLHTGRELLVVSLRLEPCLVRCDLWSPDCWKSQCANRQIRRSQIAAILGELPDLNLPVIIGGDFNAPADDPIFREFPRTFGDAFRQAGRGWGDTILNQIPLQRIDQIWINPGLQAISAGAMRTQNSDHRLVWADLRADHL